MLIISVTVGQLNLLSVSVHVTAGPYVRNYQIRMSYLSIRSLKVLERLMK